MRIAEMASAARRALSALWIVPLALVLSCADMPNAPKAMIHVTGTIQDNGGQPMFAVAIYFHIPGLKYDPYTGDPTNLPPGESPEYRGVTSPDGSYDVQLPEGTYRIVAYPLESSGYSPVVAQSVRVDRDHATWGHRYSWPKVTFHTRDLAGAAIPNSLVRLWADPQPYEPDVYLVVTGRRVGEVVEAVVPPGTYHYVVAPGGYSAGYLGAQGDLSVPSDTSVTLTAGGYAVSARVVARGGDPVSNVYVSASNGASSANAMTDYAGNASFHIPAGSYNWYVSMSDPYIAARQFRNISVAGDASIDLDMGGTEWTGTVRRTGDGAPLAGLSVFAQETNNLGQSFTETGPSGTFRLVVRTGRSHYISVTNGALWNEVGSFPNVPAGADSTFDLYVNVPVP